MDDLSQQKSQIDAEARKAKEEADRLAVESRQFLADKEIERVRKEAEEKSKQIQDDAQK